MFVTHDDYLSRATVTKAANYTWHLIICGQTLNIIWFHASFTALFRGKRKKIKMQDHTASFSTLAHHTPTGSDLVSLHHIIFPSKKKNNNKKNPLIKHQHNGLKHIYSVFTRLKKLGKCHLGVRWTANGENKHVCLLPFNPVFFYSIVTSSKLTFDCVKNK